MLHFVCIGLKHSASRIMLHTSFGRLQEGDGAVSKQHDAFEGLFDKVQCSFHLPWQVTVTSKTFLFVSGAAITALSIFTISTFSMPSENNDKRSLTATSKGFHCFHLAGAVEHVADERQLTTHFDACGEGAIAVNHAVVVGRCIFSIPLSNDCRWSAARQGHCRLRTWRK